MAQKFGDYEACVSWRVLSSKQANNESEMYTYFKEWFDDLHAVYYYLPCSILLLLRCECFVRMFRTNVDEQIVSSKWCGNIRGLCMRLDVPSQMAHQERKLQMHCLARCLVALLIWCLVLCALCVCGAQIQEQSDGTFQEHI